MPPHQSTLGHYFAAWAARTRDDILTHLAQCWTAQSSYADPITAPVTGPGALADTILQFHASFPGATLEPLSGIDTHHAFGRFAWLLRLPAPVRVDGIDYGTQTEGFDFVEFAPGHERILRIVGFFGPLAARA